MRREVYGIFVCNTSEIRHENLGEKVGRKKTGHPTVLLELISHLSSLPSNDHLTNPDDFLLSKHYFVLSTTEEKKNQEKKQWFKGGTCFWEKIFALHSKIKCSAAPFFTLRRNLYLVIKPSSSFHEENHEKYKERHEATGGDSSRSVDSRGGKTVAKYIIAAFVANASIRLRFAWRPIQLYLLVHF